MNKNIRVINENLWLVNFHYIEGGYIPELGVNRPLDEFKEITADGVLLLNSSNPITDQLYRYYDFVMGLTDKQLEPIQAFKTYVGEKYNSNALKWRDEDFITYVKVKGLESVLTMFNGISETERIRRNFVRKKYPIRSWFKRVGRYVKTNNN